MSLLLHGCATVPYTGQGPHPQVQRGVPFFPVDALGNVAAVWGKILLLDWRFANHTISERTESYVVRFLDSHPDQVGQLHVQLNQYAPHHDLKRLFTNRQVAWPYRATLGLFTTLIVDVVLPGRIFPWGDYYNPWTDTAHLYSDHPAVALHELGHAWDFGRRRFKGTYGLVRTVPFASLYQEFIASDAAVDYLIDIKDRQEELAAYRILVPAYGSYVGSYFLFPFNYLALGVGHVWGRSAAVYQRHVYHRQEERQHSQPPIVSPESDAAAEPAPSVLEPDAAAATSEADNTEPAPEPTEDAPAETLFREQEPVVH